MKIDRLLAMVLVLLNRRKVTALELSERFEVSVRTIYRDIATIDAAGIPMVSHQGAGGGFSIMDTYRLEKQLLTPDEILSMVCVLKGVGDALGDKRVRHSGEKLESLVPRDAAPRLGDEIRIELSPWGYRGAEDVLLETVRKATLQKKLVRFAYRNSTGETLDRTVEPMTLVFKGSAWYLFAYCRARSDYRLFRLSRMRDVFVDKEGFERRPSSYDTFAKRSETSSSPAVDLELKFHPRMRYLAEDTFPPEQITLHPDGTLLVRAPLPMDDWLIGWLLSYGVHVEVLRPIRIREKMKETLDALRRMYGDASPARPVIAE